MRVVRRPIGEHHQDRRPQTLRDRDTAREESGGMTKERRANCSALFLLWWWRIEKGDDSLILAQSSGDLDSRNELPVAGEDRFLDIAVEVAPGERLAATALDLPQSWLGGLLLKARPDQRDRKAFGAEAPG